MAYYYKSPSGLGVWLVDDGQTPAEAWNHWKSVAGGSFDPLLEYSIVNDPAAHAEESRAKRIPPPQVPHVRAQNRIVTRRPMFQTPYCPLGSVYDQICHCCILDTPNPPQGTSGVEAPTVTATGDGGVVTVTVQNTITVAQEVGQAIADAINAGITDAVQQARESAADVAKAVGDKMDTVIDAIKTGASDLLNGLKDALKWVYELIRNNIGTLITFITDHIGKVIDTIENFVTKDLIPLIQTVDTVIKKVNDVLQNTIAPIFNTINQVYGQTVALIDAIKQDVHNGIQGLLQLPGDISNSITSIEAGIRRTIDQIGLNKRTSADTKLKYPENDSIWNRLEAIGHGVSILGQIHEEAVTFADTVRLSEPDLTKAGARAVDALVGEIVDFTRALLVGNSKTLDALKTALPLVVPILGIELGSWVGTWKALRDLDALFEPLYKFAQDDLRGKAGLEKLNPSDALEAHRRGFISAEDLAKELEVRGWDAGRRKVLQDLQKYLVDIPTAIDMRYRGIITATDLADTLSDHGLNPEQRTAIVEQSARLLDTGLADLALRWKIIDDKAYDAVLQVHRFTDEEITLRKATLLRQESPEEVIGRERVTKLYAGLGFSPATFGDVPPEVLQAARRDGQDATVALDTWQKSFFVPSLQEWIELLFRGVRTRREYEAACDYYKVPPQFRDDLIRARRALVPWRTIPSMLANGIIEEPYAKEQLQAHGFDLRAIEALLGFAKLAHAKKKQGATGDLHSLSVANATNFFEMGAFDEEQYQDVLMAHGFDKESAALTVQVATAKEHARERKQLASDLVNEHLAGLLTLDDVTSQLSQNNFSSAERAKVLKAIQRVKRANVKTPTEAEMRAMVAKNVISLDQYESGLATLGFAKSWIEAFVKLHFSSISGPQIITATR